MPKTKLEMRSFDKTFYTQVMDKVTAFLRHFDG